MNKIFLGDCLEIMQTFESGSIDMILCDLPYGTTRAKWDSEIDLKLLWQQYNRIIKDNGPVVLFCAQPFTSKLIISNLDNFKYTWVWKKPKGTGHLNAKKMPLRDSEDIAVFYKKQCIYNPQFVKGTPYKNKAGKDHDSNSSTTELYNKYTNFRYDNQGIRYPKTIIEFPVVERDTLHPTQKPVALLEYLIKTYTNEGDLILDNCMGSASTIVAAINTNRKYIGIEKDEKYFNIAKERVELLRLQKEAKNEPGRI